MCMFCREVRDATPRYHPGVASPRDFNDDAGGRLQPLRLLSLQAFWSSA